MILFFWGLALNGFAQRFPLKTPESKVEFNLTNLGIVVDGHFNRFQGELKVNPNTGLPEFLYGEIQVNSIETGIGMRDRHLLKSDYFDAERHPQLKFRSESIQQLEKEWNIRGWITIKGRSQPIQMRAEVSKTPHGYILKTKFKVKRSAFKLGDSAVLSDEVNVIWTLFFGL